MNTPHDDMLEIWRLLMRITHYYFLQVTKNDRNSRDSELTLAQLKVLAVIADQNPAPMMVKEIAAQLGQTPGAVSQMVDTLCHLNYLERKVSETDRRSVAVSMVPAGKEQLEQCAALVAEKIASRLNAIPPEDLKTFLSVLRELGTVKEQN